MKFKKYDNVKVLKFKVDGNDKLELHYNELMENFIGKVGKIVKIQLDDGYEDPKIHVDFGDDDYWFYPKHLKKVKD